MDNSLLVHEKSNIHVSVDHDIVMKIYLFFTAYFITSLCINGTWLLHKISWHIPYTYGTSTYNSWTFQ